MKRMQVIVMALVAIVFCSPLLGEDAREARARRGGGLQGRLNEDGQAILLQHRTQQQQQMQARMQEAHNARQALRTAMRAEEDPYKQLDLLENHLQSRQAGMVEQQEKNQQARLVAYRAALEASGVEAAERDEILANMQSRQSRQHESMQAHQSEAMKQISALRANDALTREDVRAFTASHISRAPTRNRSGATRQREARPRERRRGEREATPEAE